MKEFQKVPRKQGSNRKVFRETAIPSEKTKTGKENRKTGKPVMRKEHKGNIFQKESHRTNLQNGRCRRKSAEDGV